MIFKDCLITGQFPWGLKKLIHYSNPKKKLNNAHKSIALYHPYEKVEKILGMFYLMWSLHIIKEYRFF